MNVSDTIKMLQSTIDQLSKLDPEMKIAGHLADASGGYGGDLDDPITSVGVQVDPEEGEVCLVVKY